MVQERPIRVQRRLSAIMAADVVGYSRLMHHDEEATHAKLTALLVETVHPAIAEHGGRIVKSTGDGLLAEFASAVEAVRAAMQFQTRIRELTIDEAEGNRIAFRVGINIGDVIVEPHDIFGDGVNIAARLESIAEPGGICISSSAYDHVRGKVGVEFADLGEQNLKNIALPIRAFAVARDGRSSATHVDCARQSPHHSPARLSIVVLPFANLSGDREQDYFVDGVTESLTTDLSRIGGSFVIARNTAFSYKGRAIDVRQVGRDLKIRYVLEGSVQRNGNQLRVNMRLVDAETGNHLWAERFDKPVADLFRMQDEIVSRLANTLETQLIEAEARLAERSPHPNSMDLYFQGMAWFNKGPTPDHLARARSFFEQALVLDPESVEALVSLAYLDGRISATDEKFARFAAAEAAATKALSLAPDNALAHMALGCTKICTNRVAEGIAECERALQLNRNLADAHATIGVAKIFIGRAAETETHVQEALRLSPRDSNAFRWLHCVGVAKLMLGADPEAAAWLRKSLEANRNYPLVHFHLGAALVFLQQPDEARAAIQEGLTLDPTFAISRMRRLSDHPTYRAGGKRIRDGMRMAGVPEG
jgi:TolB-like protein/class 3 adenylate cyclase/Flp pilus assembly protein TadD